MLQISGYSFLQYCTRQDWMSSISYYAFRHCTCCQLTWKYQELFFLGKNLWSHDSNPGRMDVERQYNLCAILTPPFNSFTLNQTSTGIKSPSGQTCDMASIQRPPVEFTLWKSKLVTVPSLSKLAASRILPRRI